MYYQMKAKITAVSKQQHLNEYSPNILLNLIGLIKQVWRSDELRSANKLGTVKIISLLALLENTTHKSERSENDLRSS